MDIRRAAPGDAPEIAGLMQRYWAFEGIGGFEHSSATRLLRELLSKPERGAGWVADLEHRIQGYLVAVYVFSLEHGGLMAEIDEFFVAPTIRSAGVGSMLLKTAERDLLAAGAVRLQLQLNIDNKSGREFYLRHGFEPREGYELYEKAL
jgi:GNAT superfamily N-acetyltransferase